MTRPPTVLDLLLELEDDDLWAEGLTEHRGAYRSARDRGAADRDILAVAD